MKKSNPFFALKEKFVEIILVAFQGRILSVVKNNKLPKLFWWFIKKSC
jgi:hypothetical protein